MLRIATTLVASLLCICIAGSPAQAKPTLAEGMYRVDWNRKVRDLCVDFYTAEDLSARDWQGVLAAQGPICTLRDIKETKTEASWIGRCNQPLMGRVIDVEHRVRIKTEKDGSFEIVTVMSGGQQATIPIRGIPIRDEKGKIAKCGEKTEFFRPWQ
ncbi:MAG: hypothetical protein ACRDAM_10485 [Casimicrobium sp.]